MGTFFVPKNLVKNNCMMPKTYFSNICMLHLNTYSNYSTVALENSLIKRLLLKIKLNCCISIQKTYSELSFYHLNIQLINNLRFNLIFK